VAASPSPPPPPPPLRPPPSGAAVRQLGKHHAEINLYGQQFVGPGWPCNKLDKHSSIHRKFFSLHKSLCTHVRAELLPMSHVSSLDYQR